MALTGILVIVVAIAAGGAALASKRGGRGLRTAGAARQAHPTGSRGVQVPRVSSLQPLPGLDERLQVLEELAVDIDLERRLSLSRDEPYRLVIPPRPSELE